MVVLKNRLLCRCSTYFGFLQCFSSMLPLIGLTWRNMKCSLMSLPHLSGPNITVYGVLSLNYKINNIFINTTQKIFHNYKIIFTFLRSSVCMPCESNLIYEPPHSCPSWKRKKSKNKKIIIIHKMKRVNLLRMQCRVKQVSMYSS